MPEQQVAVVQRHGIPGIKVNLDFHLITADLLKRDQRWIDCCCSLHKHPALHFRWQQPLQALELTHRSRNSS